MKNLLSKLTAITMAIAIVISSIAITTPVMAAGKTAALNNASISVNGATPTKVLVYNVDGYNYFRIADICRLLDMYVMASTDGKILNVNPSAKYNTGSVSAPLTTAPKTAPVTFATKQINYNRHFSDAQCFNVGGYNYLKLADFEKAANNSTNAYISEINWFISNNVALDKSYVSTTNVDVSYNDATKVINMNTTYFDLKKLYADGGGTTPVVTPSPMPVATPNPGPSPMPVATPSPSPAPSPKPTPTPSPSPKPTPTPSPSPSPDKTLSEDELYELAEEVVVLTNIEREAIGLPPYELDADLMNISMLKTQEMGELNYFSHTSPNYGQPWDFAKHYGYDSVNAENIAIGQTSAEGVMNSWMNSPGHKANILGTSSTKIGVGVYVTEDGTYYWAQNFAY